MFKFGRSSSTARVPRESIVTRSTKPDAPDAPPAPSEPGPAAAKADAWAAAVRTRDAAREALTRIQFVIAKHEQRAGELRATVQQADQAVSAASQRLTDLSAAAALAGDDDESPEIKEAQRNVEAARRAAEKARDVLPRAEGIDATARALGQQREQATQDLQAANDVERAARAAALQEETEACVVRYYAAAEQFMQAFYDMTERERNLIALGMSLNLTSEGWGNLIVPSANGREYTGRTSQQIALSVREAIEAKWGKVHPLHWADIWNGKPDMAFPSLLHFES
jgi:alkylated DNA repair dioxygenase AlkB